MFQEEDCGPPPPPDAKGEKGSLPKGSLPFCAEEEEDWEKAAAAKGSLLAELAEGEEKGSLGAEEEAKVVREKGSPPPRPDRGADSEEGAAVVVAAAPTDSSVPNAAATGAVNGSSLSWKGSPAAAAMSKGSP